MLRGISPLLILLGLLGTPEAQYGTCDYTQILEAGKEYYIFNPGYPSDYNPGAKCRWTARSDRPIKMECKDFSIPESYQCSLDVVAIKTDNNPAHRYCGKGEISVVSDDSSVITVTLNSSSASRGGRFLCTVKTVVDDTNCKCGQQNPTRIVGGRETGINEFPMVAGLIDVSLRYLYCGATIINNRQVLTAAHCIGDRNKDRIGVLIGEHDLSTNRETNATKLLKVERIVVHPSYTTRNYDYDIAIITVVNVIEFNRNVGPVCLPFQHSPDTFAGNYVRILGWGTTEFSGAQSQTLQEAEMEVITNRQCRLEYPEVGADKLCIFGYQKDSCQFDSGGPVLWKNPATKRLVLVGSITYGRICGDNKPSVTIRVGYYMDWILSQSPGNSMYCESE